ncbi:MAG: hypothetical protein HY906_07375 [Deltaproteobacteria bacterium]|nr:hypothetical protein [Deltaproteobacteria bacterium]
MAGSDEQARLRARIGALTGRQLPGPIRTFTDSSNYCALVGGDVLRLGGREYFILGDMTEGRFGLDEQPKPWVKRAVDLGSGGDRILKLVFEEHFSARIGPIKIRCTRSATKESQVLTAVRGHPSFMQGTTELDDLGQPVRVIEFITGPSLYHTILNLDMSHAQYAEEVLPGVFRGMLEAFAALAVLGAARLQHGDIRNDHLLVEPATGRFCWIDFDLNVNFSDFDLWSLGNVLGFVAGKGIVTFRGLAEDPAVGPALLAGLDRGDASVFFPYRVMNLHKVYPYLPAGLGRVLGHFSLGGDVTRFYRTLDELVDELRAVEAELPRTATALLDAR